VWWRDGLIASGDSVRANMIKSHRATSDNPPWEAGLMKHTQWRTGHNTHTARRA